MYEYAWCPSFSILLYIIDYTLHEGDDAATPSRVSYRIFLLGEETVCWFFIEAWKCRGSGDMPPPPQEKNRFKMSDIAFQAKN